VPLEGLLMSLEGLLMAIEGLFMAIEGLLMAIEGGHEALERHRVAIESGSEKTSLLLLAFDSLRQGLSLHAVHSARGKRAECAGLVPIRKPVSVAGVTETRFEAKGPGDPEVRALYDPFIREADGPLGIDLEAEIAAGPPRDLVPPNGVLLLVRIDGEPAGLGGIRHLDTEIAEIKTMYIAPAFRGQGVARELLVELEEISRRHGCRAVRLDTSDYLTEAIGLYRAAGYEEVAAYNRNPKASLWFERSLEEEPIRIAPYDPAWPARFERERLALEEAIGDWVTGGIHHVGSTAVPGLEAKPIIDILAGIEDLDAAKPSFGALAELGYLYAPYREEEMHWFCKPHPVRRTHHLHLVPVDSERFADVLAFRDFLRANPDAAKNYATLKRSLATRFRNDRDAYTKAKGDFIRASIGHL
jgi:GrpB-like predicted nucleotidyltransferase (UPF0157 family)/ribosomal protein S18 acetylase RimI-like enzyme